MDACACLSECVYLCMYVRVCVCVLVDSTADETGPRDENAKCHSKHRCVCACIHGCVYIYLCVLSEMDLNVLKHRHTALQPISSQLYTGPQFFLARTIAHTHTHTKSEDMHTFNHIHIHTVEDISTH